MAIDPKDTASLDMILGEVKSIRDRLTGVVIPPDPTPSTPVTIVATSVARTGPATVVLSYVLAGTVARFGKIGVAVAQGNTWQEFPAPTATTGTVTIAVGATAGTLHFHVWDLTAAAWVIKTSVPYTANVGPGPDPDPDPGPPPGPGQGVFTFATDAAGNTVVKRDGKLFIPIGVNMPGPNGYWGGGFTPMGKAARLASTWKWNLIRLFEQNPGGGECQYCPSANNAWSLQQVVDEYTAAGFVVMIDWHQYDFGREYGPAQTVEMITKWTAWANQFKNNPNVWFELANEPEATFHSYSHGATNDQQAKTMMYQRWYDAFAPVVKAIRATGATNVIVVNDAQAGQGCDDFWQIGASTGSAIMAKGAALLAQDPTGNLMWDVHVYDAFGWSNLQAGCTPRYTDAQRDARLVDYVKRVWAATGRPVLAGEFGWQQGESATSGSGFHYPYLPACGSRTLLGQQALTRVGVSLGMGGTQWPGFQLCTSGTDAYDASVLTPCGADWFNFCQRARTAMTPATPAAPLLALTEEELAVSKMVGDYRLALPQRKVTLDA